MSSIILNGPNAFYNQPNYLETLKKEVESKELLPTLYTCNSPEWEVATESKVIIFARYFFAIVIFPIAIYHIIRAAFHLIHGVLGIPVLPSSVIGYFTNVAEEDRIRLFNRISKDESDFKAKRFSIGFDGYKLDVMILGTEETFKNGRWTLASVGNGQFYEDLISDATYRNSLKKTGSSGIFFNYPSVGMSSGALANREATIKAYKVMLSFLENHAKEIIGYGFSIGGVVQEALEDYPLKDKVNYLFVKDKSLSSVSAVAGPVLGILAKLAGWDISSVKASKNLKAREIIFQHARDVPQYGKLEDSQLIRDDDVISAEASIAKALLDDPECPKKDKLFVGTVLRHIEPVYSELCYPELINQALNYQKEMNQITLLSYADQVKLLEQKRDRDFFDSLDAVEKRKICIAIGKEHWDEDFKLKSALFDSFKAEEDQEERYRVVGLHLQSLDVERFLKPAVFNYVSEGGYVVATNKIYKVAGKSVTFLHREA